MIRHSLNYFLAQLGNEQPSRFNKDILLKATQYLNDENNDFHKRLRTGYSSLCKSRHLSPRITDHYFDLKLIVTDNQKRIDNDSNSKAKVL